MLATMVSMSEYPRRGWPGRAVRDRCRACAHCAGSSCRKAATGAETSTYAVTLWLVGALELDDGDRERRRSRKRAGATIRDRTSWTARSGSVRYP